MALSRNIRAFLSRFGWAPAPPHRSVIIFVPEAADCTGLEWLVAQLHQRNARLTVFFIPGSDHARNWLAQHFGFDAILEAPWSLRATCFLFVLTSRMRLMLGVGDVARLPEKLMKEAYLQGIPLAMVEARFQPDSAANPPNLLPWVDWWLPHGASDRADLTAWGIPEQRMSAELAGASRAVDSYAATLDHLHALMARRPPDRRILQRWTMAGFEHPLWRRFLAIRARRIDSLAGLRSALGNPQTILCLGNGPSSENPALRDIEYDCLFRVNHRWLKRGFFCDPDLVFTGQKRTLFTVKKAIFAFQTRRAEAHLATHQIFNPLCRHMRFVTLERIGILDGHDWDGVRPTNGATMLAAAAALAPKRLVIAGIDLFEDPSGPYPDDASTPNDYVLVHERDLEAKFVLKTLRDYRGELVILSKVLAEKWAASQKSDVEPLLDQRLYS